MPLQGTEEHHHAVILAGGRGIRFWPRSRRSRPKQLLAELGSTSLLRQTADRLLAVVPPERLWVVTAESLRSPVADELPEMPDEHIIAEPTPRNTAPAIGLAALLVSRADPQGVMGVFSADHHLETRAAYLSLLQKAFQAAAGNQLIVVGIPPRWAETGYGYIEFAEGAQPSPAEPLPIVRFSEKPTSETARAFLKSGRFYWNSGQFFWKASVFAEEMRQHLPRTWEVLTGIATHSQESFRSKLADRYGLCQNISVDRGILERSSRVAGLVAPDIGWSDIGSWHALYALLPKDPEGNCARTPALFVRAEGNYIDVPGKQVALLGVQDLVVVETPDALLVCPRSEAQNVSELVEGLRAAGRDDLL